MFRFIVRKLYAKSLFLLTAVVALVVRHDLLTALLVLAWAITEVFGWFNTAILYALEDGYVAKKMGELRPKVFERIDDAKKYLGV